MHYTPEEIVALYKKYHTPRNVIKHMVKVAKYAKKLTKKLSKKGHKINKKLVEEAALLHDLVRVCDFRELSLKKLKQTVTSEDLKQWLHLREKYKTIGHVKAAAQILNKLGRRKLASLIKKHDFFEVDNLKTWEEKILYYADKRVDGYRMVSLKRRFKKGKKRNLRPGESLRKLQAIEKKVFKLEQEIKQALKAPTKPTANH
ncbi:HDIG domain-containing protein [Candidatus Peregrinibacteria bacterium]|jgi:putative nucleotidyltransferase with HDIG domain|nr:HDIG domain-containing protein [Candidatus Peregrinibacteria bacterium]MBT4056216.1 HDIG domain-containing protein [Candidatus Peregrinibacteria bacterium]